MYNTLTLLIVIKSIINYKYFKLLKLEWGINILDNLTYKELCGSLYEYCTSDISFINTNIE